MIRTTQGRNLTKWTGKQGGRSHIFRLQVSDSTPVPKYLNPGAVSSHISEWRNFWLHTIYACAEYYSEKTNTLIKLINITWLRNSCLGMYVGLGWEKKRIEVND